MSLEIILIVLYSFIFQRGHSSAISQNFRYIKSGRVGSRAEFITNGAPGLNRWAAKLSIK